MNLVIVLSGLILSISAFASTQHPADFVHLRAIDPSILQELRYAQDHNFVGRPIVGYQAAECLLTRKAALALQHAQQRFLKLGYTLKVYDCYRPQRAVADFVEWSHSDSTLMKTEFYPHLDKSVLFPDYIAYYSGHSRGSTVDLTLVKLPVTPSADYHPGDQLSPCTAPASKRFADNSIDMGTGWDCLDPKANTAHRPLSPKAIKNRALLHQGMKLAGFNNYPKEWWHYTLKNERYRHRYFDFPVE